LLIVIIKSVITKCWSFRTDKICNELRDFLENRDIVFCTVDKTGDKLRLGLEGIVIPPKNWIDIQDLFKIPRYSRPGMDFLAENIIDRSYAKMKNEFPTTMHNLWEERPLDDFNLRYAAVDAYVSFQLGVRTSFFRRNLVVPQKTIVCQGCKRDASEIAKEEEAAARSRTYT
jgi:hypothetical protein